MVLTAGPAPAQSFTDDTSLPYTGASIHAQVLRDYSSLDWFYTLLQRAPNHDGELKSSIIVPVFFGLPDYERRKVLATLKRVRIHVTDPRPYTFDVDQYLAEIIKDLDVEGFLNRLATGQRHAAKSARGSLIANEMWRDAPSYQLRLKHLVYEYRAGLRIITDSREPPEDTGQPLVPQKGLTTFDPKRFEKPRKSIVNELAPYLSKSESVFCDALAQMDAILESGAASPLLVVANVTTLLAQSHAFDAGHPDQVKWLREERDEVIEWMDPHGTFPMPAGALSEPESTDSYFIQAADYAAAIARELLSRHKLPVLVDKFDYVTYNGPRIWENQAAAIQTDLDKRSRMTTQQN